MLFKNSPFMNSGDPAPLSNQQRQDWNNYVDYVSKKGYAGSSLLDKKDTGLAKSLFDSYLQENPKSTINFDSVKSVQAEMQQLQKSAQAFAKRRNDPNADNIMNGISSVDGWPGSKTTSFKFPNMQFVQNVNNQPVSSKNLGLVDSSLNPATNLQQKTLPPGAKLEEMADGWYYEDPQSGELVKYKNK